MPDCTLVGDRFEDEMRHELHDVAGGEVLAGLLVVLLAEAPDQLLEDGAHAVVVEAGHTQATVGVEHGAGAEVDRAVEELCDQKAENVIVHQARDLVAEPELFQDLLHVGREAVEVGFEVGAQLLLLADGAQVAQPEGRCVVEGFARRLAQGLILVGDTGSRPAAPSCAAQPSLVGSRTASRRRMTVMGRMTSRYLPRT